MVVKTIFGTYQHPSLKSRKNPQNMDYDEIAVKVSQRYRPNDADDEFRTPFAAVGSIVRVPQGHGWSKEYTTVIRGVESRMVHCTAV